MKSPYFAFATRMKPTILDSMKNLTVQVFAFSLQTPLLPKNAHLMTLIPRYKPREISLAGLPQESRLVTVEPQSRLQGVGH